MGTEIDRLEVKIEAQARGANQQLENLCKKLESLRNSLSGVNASGMTGLADGVSKLATAMVKMNGIKTTDFTRLAKNIQKLGDINAANINSAANAINTIAQSLSSISGVTTNAQSVSELAKNIAKLGNKSTSNAIDSLPKLSLALKNMMQTLSAAPQVSNNVIRMTQAMASLASHGSRVSSASVNLSTGFRQYTESTRKATSGTKGLSSALGSLYQKYFWVKRLFTALSKSITSSMDYIEEYNYYNVTMDKVAAEWQDQWEKYGYDNAESYAASFQGRMSELLGKMTGYSINTNGTLTDTQAQNLGLDVTSLTNYSAGLMQVTNSLGLTGEASETTSKALTMLAGDMSSFRNLDLKTVMTNFQSGLIGQSRSLYKYGIDITNATLQTYAYENGITKAVSEMTQAEKMQLRLIAILDQSKVAWGDLANTINSPSNQIRLLKNNFSALSRTIGNIFLPVVAKVLPYVNGLVIAVRRLFTWIGSLLGVDLSDIISNSSAGYSDSFEDLADGADDASSAIDGVGKSAKEANKQLASFDELNNLTTNDSSSAGSASKGTGDTIDLTDQLTAALADYEFVWNKAFEDMENTANKYADSVVGFFAGIAKYAEPSVDSVKRLWNDGLKKFRNFAATGAQDFLDEFLIPLGKWTLGKGFPMLVDATNDFLNDIDWKMLNKNLKNFWKVLEPFAEGIGEGLITFFKGLTKIGAGVINGLGYALGFFGDTLFDFEPNTIKEVGEAFGLLLGTLLLFQAIVSITTGIKVAGTAISGFFTLLSAHPYALIAAGIIGVVAAVIGISEASKSVDVLKDINSEFDETTKNAETEAALMKNLADRYNELMEKTELSNEERSEAQRLSKQLVDNYPELEEYYNNETGLLEANKEKIDEVITAKLREIKVKAYEDKLLALEKKKLEVQDKLNEAQKKQSELSAQNAKYLKGLNHQYQSVGDTINYVVDSLTGKVAANTNEFSANTAQLNEYERQLDTISEEIDNTTAAYNQLNIEQENVSESNADMADTVVSNSDNIAETTQNTINNINSAANNLKDNLLMYNGQIADSSEGAAENTEGSYQLHTENVKGQFNSLLGHAKNVLTQMADSATGGANAFSNNYKNELNNLQPNITSFFSGMMGSLQEISKSSGTTIGEYLMNNLAKTIDEKRSLIQNTLSSSISSKFKADLSGDGGGGGFTLSLQPKAYAGGGFPQMGQIFLARESGPEYVGTMGGHTAVANNDQIVEGIADGIYPAVYNAFMQALSRYNANGSNNIQVFVGGKEITDVVVKDINEATMMTGECPILF